MRFALVLLAAAGLLAQGVPVSTSVGELFCGARLYTPSQVQTYCLLTSTSPPSVVHNALHSIAFTPLPSVPPGTSSIGSAIDVYTYCTWSKEIDVIWWLISWNDINKPVQYDIYYSACLYAAPSCPRQELHGHF